ncbi:hypothetical protein DFP81_103317 [Marinomonas pollencensis]|uniref:Uncharacterized protein n=1 Tax=Marinomonas pollencensis TaxID=491954 RepID=A0A3E0DQ84_9GAMM|nr:hypothetical protein DFP81_103317 [Marinomonas pollencensis]
MFLEPGERRLINRQNRLEMHLVGKYLLSINYIKYKVLR